MADEEKEPLLDIESLDIEVLEDKELESVGGGLNTTVASCACCCAACTSPPPTEV